MKLLWAGLLLWQSAAPELHLRLGVGRELRLESLRGSPVIVQFFNPN
jgi:hypothetical protein